MHLGHRQIAKQQLVDAGSGSGSCLGPQRHHQRPLLTDAIVTLVSGTLLPLDIIPTFIVKYHGRR